MHCRNLLRNIYMSEDESAGNIDQAVANLQRQVMAMRQILTLLLAHHAMHSAVPTTLSSLKDLLDQVYAGDALEAEIREQIDGIIGDANTLISSAKPGST
jgi:hypothetical protein